MQRKEKNMSDIDFSNLDFEEAMSQLETIVHELEAGKIKLDDAVSAYEKAVALKKFCEEKLKQAELKIEKINIAPNGTINTEKFETTEE